MTYKELAEIARGQMGQWCNACPTCNGRACGSSIPGPGSKGSGNVAARNYEAWKDYRLAMDTIGHAFEATSATEILGRALSLPVMVGPVGDVNRHYGEKYDTVSYNDAVLRAAAGAGTVGWIGDGLDSRLLSEGLGLISSLDGAGVATIKPWSMDVVFEKLEEALDAHPMAVAMDVDAAGLPFLRGQEPPAGAKSVGELRQIARRCHDADVPFIVKGVMTVKGANKAARAEADAIVVSNHGGRVLDGVPATAEVLPEIVDEVGGALCVLVDGGIRSGIDVFRALALGARGVLMCRPFVVATYGGGAEGVQSYLAQITAELCDAMEMCGAETVADIDRDMLW